MKNSYRNGLFQLQEIAFSSFAVASIAIIGFILPSFAESSENEYLPENREIHNTFSEDQNDGTLLDASNQMELMQRIRQANTLLDATSPSDAIDEALQELYLQETEQSL